MRADEVVLNLKGSEEQCCGRKDVSCSRVQAPQAQHAAAREEQ